MSQKFPDIHSTDYVDTGILDLQYRDDAVLSMFSGDSAPENPFQDLLWNDTLTNCIKRYNNGSWDTVVNYGLNYITKGKLAYEYQPINANLTNYANAVVTGGGFINNSFVPVSSFFINKLSQEIPNNIGLGKFAYKSKITSNDVLNNSIPETKLSTTVETNAPYKVGDCIPSFNKGNKNGCVKLSTSSTIKYTVGASASSATYKGTSFQNLFNFVWSNLNLPIYTSTGVSTSKGSSWQTDWNNNKRVELPHITLPTENEPSNYNIISETVDGTRSKESLDQETQYNSQKTKSGSITIPKDGYYEIVLVGGGGGSSNKSDHTDDHSGHGGAGALFRANVLLYAGKLNYEIGYGGKGCGSNARNNNGFDGSYSKITSYAKGYNVIINCPGGYGGKSSRSHGHDAPINQRAEQTGYYQGWSFAPTWTINTGYVAILNNSSTGSRKDSWYGNYGKGGDKVGDTSAGKEGNNGFISIRYLGPKEYGTTDQNKIDDLNRFYNSISYFMKQ